VLAFIAVEMVCHKIIKKSAAPPIKPSYSQKVSGQSPLIEANQDLKGRIREEATMKRKAQILRWLLLLFPN